MSFWTKSAPLGQPSRFATVREATSSAGGGRLLELYNSYFDILQAETAEQLMAAFRLRYQVYCVENPFEDPQQNPQGMETDQYDAAAPHSLLVHRETGEMVGTVRLILPRQGKEGMGLPIRQICRHELVARDNSALPWSTTAEISRFAVSKTFRRRAGDGTVVGRFSDLASDPRRRVPDTSLGLMQAVIGMAAKNGISHLCAVMEPALLRMLRRFGMILPAIGPEVDYHGRRQPCYTHLDTGLARVWLHRADVWELLTRGGEYWPLNRELVVSLRENALGPARQLSESLV